MTSISEGAVEQQDAAVEAGASHGASLLILVLSGPQEVAPDVTMYGFRNALHTRSTLDSTSRGKA
jgi:hypothetical protein